MKKLIVSLCAVASLAPNLAMAADSHDGHAHHGAMHVDVAPAGLVDGLVRRVDKAGGKLTVSHGPLPGGMPAMTMAFRLADVSWLDKVKDGQKIRFASENIGGVLTIVRLEPAK